MTNQVGPAAGGGSMMAPGSGAAGATGVSGASAVAGVGPGQDVAPFISQVPGTPVSFPSFHGRAVSWTVVGIIVAAFLAGGAALVWGPTWWLFWVSAGAAVLGGLLGLATGIFNDWY